MGNRHLPAIVAAAISAVLVAGVGLAAGSDDTSSETETVGAVSPTTTARRSTTTTDRVTTTSSGETTTTTSADGDTTTSAAPAPTTAAPTSAPRPTLPPPTEAPTTAPPPAAFEIVAGPSPASVTGCGGSTQITVRNVGGQTGDYQLRASQPAWVTINAQLRLTAGGETAATVTVSRHNGPAVVGIALIDGATGGPVQNVDVGITEDPNRTTDCSPK